MYRHIGSFHKGIPRRNWKTSEAIEAPFSISSDASLRETIQMQMASTMNNNRDDSRDISDQQASLRLRQSRRERGN